MISDSFKGTLSSLEICRIARESIPRFFPDCQVITAPVADGGEGLVECFEAAIGAQPVTVSVTGPLGKPVRATYARKDKTAIVEMAAAAGLPMMGRNGDPARTTTYGVGELIRHAIENGCTEILLGLGGSATNDGAAAVPQRSAQASMIYMAIVLSQREPRWSRSKRFACPMAGRCRRMSG